MLDERAMSTDTAAPPPHPYTRASSAYSAVVQLYARSSQLDTALSRHLRLRDPSPYCRFGCDALETTHHVFAHCAAFKDLRTSAAQSILDDTSEQLRAAETPFPYTDIVLDTAKKILTNDSSVWPQHSTRYYLGTLPPVLCDAQQCAPLLPLIIEWSRGLCMPGTHLAFASPVESGVNTEGVHRVVLLRLHPSFPYPHISGLISPLILVRITNYLTISLFDLIRFGPAR